MTYTIAGAALSTRPTKLTTTAVTDLFVATKRTTILSVVACEVNGGTVDFSLEMFDGTTSYYFYREKTMNDHDTLIYNEPFVLNNGWKLRASISPSDEVHVFVTHAEPDATALRQGGF